MSNETERQEDAPGKCGICGRPAWLFQEATVARTLCDEHAARGWDPLAEIRGYRIVLTTCSQIQATRGEPYVAINRIRGVALEALIKDWSHA